MHCLWEDLKKTKTELYTYTQSLAHTQTHTHTKRSMTSLAGMVAESNPTTYSIIVGICAL